MGKVDYAAGAAKMAAVAEDYAALVKGQTAQLTTARQLATQQKDEYIQMGIERIDEMKALQAQIKSYKESMEESVNTTRAAIEKTVAQNAELLAASPVAATARLADVLVKLETRAETAVTVDPSLIASLNALIENFKGGPAANGDAMDATPTETIAEQLQAVIRSNADTLQGLNAVYAQNTAVIAAIPSQVGAVMAECLARLDARPELQTANALLLTANARATELDSRIQLEMHAIDTKFKAWQTAHVDALAQAVNNIQSNVTQQLATDRDVIAKELNKRLAAIDTHAAQQAINSQAQFEKIAGVLHEMSTYYVQETAATKQRILILQTENAAKLDAIQHTVDEWDGRSIELGEAMKQTTDHVATALKATVEVVHHLLTSSNVTQTAAIAAAVATLAETVQSATEREASARLKQAAEAEAAGAEDVTARIQQLRDQQAASLQEVVQKAKGEIATLQAAIKGIGVAQIKADAGTRKLTDDLAGKIRDMTLASSERAASDSGTPSRFTGGYDGSDTSSHYEAAAPNVSLTKRKKLHSDALNRKKGREATIELNRLAFTATEPPQPGAQQADRGSGEDEPADLATKDLSP